MDRLTAIVLLLQGGRRTASEIARRFEVSKRTVFRDIEALCEMGIPIVTEAGVNGGYTLMPDYSLTPPQLTFKEMYHAWRTASVACEAKEHTPLSMLSFQFRQLHFSRANQRDLEPLTHISLQDTQAHQIQLRLTRFQRVFKERHTIISSYTLNEKGSIFIPQRSWTGS